MNADEFMLCPLTINHRHCLWFVVSLLMYVVLPLLSVVGSGDGLTLCLLLVRWDLSGTLCIFILVVSENSSLPRFTFLSAALELIVVEVLMLYA